MSAAPVFWALIPAAGAGRRMGGATPKQYLELAGRPVIEHVLARFVDHPWIAGTLVVLDPSDDRWEGTSYAGHPRVHRAEGGAERCHSVLNGLDALAALASSDVWVLVHDAARPCLRPADLERMLETLADDPVGGILAVPVRDTMKRADGSGRIGATVDREALWHALTPQMFRLGVLREALSAVVGAGDLVTDEAEAVERMGRAPRLVEGHADNLKVTRPEDLSLARFFLESQGRSC